jgi:cell division protein FtsB
LPLPKKSRFGRLDRSKQNQSGGKRKVESAFRIAGTYERTNQMIGPARNVFVLAIGFVAMLTAGCGQQEAPDVKQTRAIAAENIELRKRVERLNREIERLKEQHEKAIKKQEKLLAQCQQDKETWKKKARQNIRSQVEPVLDAVMDETAKLREENTKLKAQIEQLQKESDH